MGGDRSKLFYFLYCFLCQYNPESIMTVNSKNFAHYLQDEETSANEIEDKSEVDTATLSSVENITETNETCENDDVNLISTSNISCATHPHITNDESKRTNRPLAVCFPHFPDHLFGGKGSSSSNLIRRLFGYPLKSESNDVS